MPPFHDNKLNTVNLDDSDDQSYTPTKKSAKNKKTTPKPKTKALPKSKTGTPVMGCSLSKLKRKRDAGQVGTMYAGHDNRSTDSGMAGMPLETPEPSSSGSSIAPPLTTLRDLFPFLDPEAVNSQSSLFNITDTDLEHHRQYSRGYEMLGDPPRRHLGGFDVDLRVPTEYPNAPRMNSWAAREHCENFRELPGNVYDSFPDLNGEQGTLHGQPELSNNSFNDNLGGNLIEFNDTDMYGDNPRAGNDAPGAETPGSEDSVEDRMGVEVKEERDQSDHLVSSTHADNEYDESDLEDRRASKVPKINKDGAPRKPRQPRPKLLKWTDNDWKNVALGLVWACGENGIPIPFDQAAQVVGDSCTAGALQQALLKLRGKQIAEGNQIPSLRMAWARKNKNSTSSSSTANANNAQGTTVIMPMLPKKKPTRWEGNQTLLITLKRAYQKVERMHLDFPHLYKKGSCVRTGNAIMINDGSSGAANKQTTTVYHADQYEDCVMEDAKSSLGLDINHNISIPQANDHSNGVMAFSTNTAIGNAPLPRNSSSSTHGQVGPCLNTGSPINRNNATRHRRTMAVQHDPRHIAGMFLDGSLISPTRPMPQNFDAGCDFVTSDPSMRYRNYVVFDHRSDLNVPSMSNQFNNRNETMPLSPCLSPAQAGNIRSSDSSVDNKTGNSIYVTAPTTPVGSSTYGPAFGTPDAGSFHGVGDSATAIGGSHDIPYGTYSSPGQAPITPPRSAAADRIVSDRLNSTLRQDGAFNPQGNTNTMYRGMWNAFNGMEDWPLNAPYNGYHLDVEDGEEDDTKHVITDDGHDSLPDPFVEH